MDRRGQEEELEIRSLLSLSAALGLAAGCDSPSEQPQEPPPIETRQVPPSITDASPVPADPPSAQAPADAGDAVEVLRTYYDAIAARDYAAAWTLRSGQGTLDQFAASFADFAEYRADIGQAGPVASAGTASYVDIPVQIYGTRRSGLPFVTAGTVTLRRSGDGPWLIHAPG